VGNEEIINAVKKVKSQIDSGMSLSLQKLAASLLANNNHVWQKNLLSSYQESISAVEKLLTSLDIEVSLPQAGLYFWVKIPIQYDNSEQYADYLLKKKLILVTPGTAFGRSGTRYIRVSITQYPELIESYI
jgi:aspartate/methionine/tyrosine aminotransferase